MQSPVGFALLRRQAQVASLRIVVECAAQAVGGRGLDPDRGLSCISRAPWAKTAPQDQTDYTLRGPMDHFLITC